MTEIAIDSNNIAEHGVEINIDELLLDTENPRLYAQRREGALDTLQDVIKQDLLSKNHIPALKASIVQTGLQDAIYVQFRPEYGKYVVIEGNTRTAIHMELRGTEAERESPYSFGTIRSHIIKQNVHSADLAVMKVILQVAKADWGKCERAMLMHEMHYEHGRHIADIAVHFQCAKGEVESSLFALSVLSDYQEATGDTDSRKFSFFSKECPAKVREWFKRSPQNLEDYIGYIGDGRIPSVSVRGGLRDFAKFVDHPEILGEFKSDPTMSVEQACQRVLEEDLLASFKWMKHLNKYTDDLYKLSNPTYQAMLATDNDLKTSLKSLKRALDQVTDIIDTL
ncbi:MAG: hypothetical protein CMB65_03955 [Euryarchaeota archaeon]|nr:hypothetical protein [Euryarchaeota archaeon]